MANVRPWLSEPNFECADFSTATLLAKSYLWNIKGLLVGNVGAVTQGRWAHYQSCDSVTVSAVEGTDLWGATFDQSKIVRFSGAGAHSWVVLKSPAGLGPYYLILDWNTPADNRLSITFSKVAPTGGTTSARPTASDEVGPPHTTLTQFCRGAASRTRLHISKTADGEFFIVANVNALGRFSSCFAFLIVGEGRAADTNKAVVFVHSDNNPVDTSISAQILSDPFTAANTWTYNVNTSQHTNVISSNNSNVGAPMMTRLYDGGAGSAASCAALLPCFYGNFGNLANTGASIVGAAPWNTSSQIIGAAGAQVPATSAADSQDGDWDTLPIFIAGTGFLKGKLIDVSWVASGAAEGAFDSAVTPQQMICGSWSVPWTNTTGPTL